jgi:hypothetical protein
MDRLDAVAFEDLPLIGALDLEPTPEGVYLRRLPASTRSKMTDPATQLVARIPAGVRLCFEAATPEIELDVLATAIQVLDQPYAMPTFDVTVDGEQVGSAPAEQHALLRILGTTPADLVLVPGEVATVRFSGLPVEPGRIVEIWFPHNSLVELRAARVAGGALSRPDADTRRRWVHHGSSISHCLEALRPTETWPALVARSAGVSLLGLGLAGQCMLDQYVARTIRDLDADVISLKLGINIVNGDTMRERTFGPAVHGFLDTIRDGHPTTPIVVITPITCPVAEDHPGPTRSEPGGQLEVVPRDELLSTGALTLTRIRAILRDIVELRRTEGDANLHLVEGTALLGPDDVELLPDGLHPGPEGYRLMAERFYDEAFAPGRPLAPAGP